VKVREDRLLESILGLVIEMVTLAHIRGLNGKVAVRVDEFFPYAVFFQ
jgi:hypothetical protein